MGRRQTMPIGSIVGAIAGLIFVLANAGAVPASFVWRAAAVAAFAGVMWFAVRRGPEIEPAQPSPPAMRTYAVSVAAMVVAIPLGATVLTSVLDLADAIPIWVVFVVGAHFWPFARAFQLPVFAWLAVSLAVVSLLGAVATGTSADDAAVAGWTGVAAGFVLLTFAAVGPHLAGSMTRRPADR